MGILSWIVFGLIAGAIAKLIHRGDDPDGWLITIVIGIVGAFIGGAIGKYLLGYMCRRRCHHCAGDLSPGH
jgi:uncharacterized membrane protein YeaQ/YmgE (transglycosylase-associated protein family)